jgi:hypothetical protein
VLILCYYIILYYYVMLYYIIIVCYYLYTFTYIISAQRPQPEPQRKSSQPKLSSFFRRASREEVAEQAAERMEFIAVAAAEAKAAAEERAAGAPPRRPPGRPPRQAPVLVLTRAGSGAVRGVRCQHDHARGGGVQQGQGDRHGEQDGLRRGLHRQARCICAAPLRECRAMGWGTGKGRQGVGRGGGHARLRCMGHGGTRACIFSPNLLPVVVPDILQYIFEGRPRRAACRR